MQRLFILLALITYGASAQGIYEHKLKLTDGKEIDLSQYKGKPIVFANIATRCGYTGQLENLENLYKNFKKKGLVVIGIPSNDFGGQTPESDGEVGKFCRLKYGATFPITEKTVVTGKQIHPLVKSLLSQAGVESINWNFEKFVFDGTGKFVSHYRSGVKPDSEEITKKIESLLK